jgi:hypothetical protein
MKSELNYLDISQTIADLNTRTQEFKRFNHTWNQNIHCLERSSINTRAGRIMKSIKEQLSSISTSNHASSGSFFPEIIDSQPPSTTSKKSVTVSSLKKASLKPKLVKQNTFKAALDDLDASLHEGRSFNISQFMMRKASKDRFEEVKQLFNLSTVFSEQKTIKMREVEDKVIRMRNSLKEQISVKEDLVLPSFQVKKVRAMKKLKATQVLKGVSNGYMKKSESLSASKSKMFKLDAVRS